MSDQNPSEEVMPPKKTHSTLSQALLISSFKTIKHVFPHILVCMECNVSYAAKMLLEISLPGIKVL
jgi:hypothetical protein